MRKSVVAVPCEELEGAGCFQMRYVLWEPEEGQEVCSEVPVVCVHGLSRNARDFEPIAAALVASGRRVITVDVPGRALSDRLQNPQHYGYPQYKECFLTLLQSLPYPEVDWIGTSMGGLIAMFLMSAQADDATLPGAKLRRVVFNDIGPFVPRGGLLRLCEYIGKEPEGFATMEEAETWLRGVFAPFALDDAGWRRVAESTVVPAEGGGGWRLHYDLRIAEAFALDPAKVQDIDMFGAVWRAPPSVRAYIVRGALSDLLLPDCIDRMRSEGSVTVDGVLEVPGVGHAPMFFDAAQMDPVVAWLNQ